MEYRLYPEKYDVSYIDGKDNLATQHNHPPDALSPPSPEAFIEALQKEWADYSFCISNSEIWVIKHQGEYSRTKQTYIENNIGPIAKKAEEMLKTQPREYVNNWYEKEIDKHLNSLEERDIYVTKVVL